MHRSSTSAGYVAEVAARLGDWPDAFQLRHAIEAHASGAPAYLDFRAGDHCGDQVQNLVCYANTLGGLIGACRALEDQFGDDRHTSPKHFDRLVPLNGRAVADLSNAYVKLLGTFRERNELLDRNPLFSLETSVSETEAA